MLGQNHLAGSRDLYHNPEVLGLLKARNRGVQERLWRLERPGLNRLATSLLHSAAEAENLVADLFYDFFFHYVDRVRETRAIPAYLTIMTVRRAHRQIARSRRLAALDEDRTDRDPAPPAEDQLEGQVWLRWLEQCQQRLGARARAILKMHYGHEWSYSAIGTHLGHSKQAIGKTVQKSLSALKKCLEKHRAASGR